VRQSEGVPARVERREERVLLVAIAALLIAGLAAALLIRGDLDQREIAQEAGSLLAPPSDASFTDAFGRPVTPTSAIPGPGELNGLSGDAPSPETPGNAPPPNPGPEEPPEEPPGNDGILGFLSDLPILPPPPLLGSATAHRRPWGLR
jgi:hypothetical protein